jgi:hypothetical protein
MSWVILPNLKFSLFGVDEMYYFSCEKMLDLCSNQVDKTHPI